jgi:hypothetical protein
MVQAAQLGNQQTMSARWAQLHAYPVLGAAGAIGGLHTQRKRRLQGDLPSQSAGASLTQTRFEASVMAVAKRVS